MPVIGFSFYVQIAMTLVDLSSVYRFVIDWLKDEANNARH